MYCPKLKTDCKEKDCAWWIVLYQDDSSGNKVEFSKCAVTWMPSLMTELTTELTEIRKNLSGKKE